MVNSYILLNLEWTPQSETAMSEEADAGLTAAETVETEQLVETPLVGEAGNAPPDAADHDAPSEPLIPGAAQVGVEAAHAAEEAAGVGEGGMQAEAIAAEEAAPTSSQPDPEMQSAAEAEGAPLKADAGDAPAAAESVAAEAAEAAAAVAARGVEAAGASDASTAPRAELKVVILPEGFSHVGKYPLGSTVGEVRATRFKKMYLSYASPCRALPSGQDRVGGRPTPTGGDDAALARRCST